LVSKVTKKNEISSATPGIYANRQSERAEIQKEQHLPLPILLRSIGHELPGVTTPSFFYIRMKPFP